MTRIQQLLSCYLTLCLAGGGAVGLSPVLHQLIEHGGHGPAHIHAGFAGQASDSNQQHGVGEGDRGCNGPLGGTAVRQHTGRWFAHEREAFGWPKLSLASLWHSLGHLRNDSPSDESQPSKRGPGHDHRSVFQLLANGLLDQPTEGAALPTVPSSVTTRVDWTNPPLIVREWDAQTAPRGPPASHS